MWVGLLTDRINNKLEKRNLINEHALKRELVPLNYRQPTDSPARRSFVFMLSW